MTLATLLLVHGDDGHLDLVYFWAAVLIALTPVIIFGRSPPRKLPVHGRRRGKGPFPVPPSPGFHR